MGWYNDGNWMGLPLSVVYSQCFAELCTAINERKKVINQTSYDGYESGEEIGPWKDWYGWHPDYNWDAFPDQLRFVEWTLPTSPVSYKRFPEPSDFDGTPLREGAHVIRENYDKMIEALENLITGTEDVYILQIGPPYQAMPSRVWSHFVSDSSGTTTYYNPDTQLPTLLSNVGYGDSFLPFTEIEDIRFLLQVKGVLDQLRYVRYECDIALDDDGVLMPLYKEQARRVGTDWAQMYMLRASKTIVSGSTSIKFRAWFVGAAGNNISIEYAAPEEDPNPELQCEVNGEAIKFILKTDEEGNSLTTAADIIAKLKATDEAYEKVQPINQSSLGAVVGVVAPQNLAGGTNNTVSQQLITDPSSFSYLYAPGGLRSPTSYTPNQFQWHSHNRYNDFATKYTYGSPLLRLWNVEEYVYDDIEAETIAYGLHKSDLIWYNQDPTTPPSGWNWQRRLEVGDMIRIGENTPGFTVLMMYEEQNVFPWSGEQYYSWEGRILFDYESSPDFGWKYVTIRTDCLGEFTYG